MRKLKAKDIAPFTKIISKMEMKDTIKTMFCGEHKDGEMVSEFVIGFIDNFPKAEKDLFEFLGELEGKPADDIAELDLSELINLVTSLFSGENIPFFKSVSK
jgi:hypothetical protein